MTPTALAARAEALARELDGLTVEVEGREEIVARGMGAFAAVAQGTYEEPALITLRYDGRRRERPDARLHRQGRDLRQRRHLAQARRAHGGDEVRHVGRRRRDRGDRRDRAPASCRSAASASSARPRTCPSGRSVKPGDIVTPAGGRRRDQQHRRRGPARARRLHRLRDRRGRRAARRPRDADRRRDRRARSTYAGLLSNDDALAAQVSAAGERTGELVWRLPLHAEYDELVKGTFADLNNAPGRAWPARSPAREFLHRFAGETPWAHLDIAGTAWDLGRAYAEKGGSGYGVRLLVELARSFAS